MYLAYKTKVCACVCVRVCVCVCVNRSVYREMLFLTLAAMGKDHVGKTELSAS